MVEFNNKIGQIGYFTSVMLIFIGFAFFGIFIIQNASLTGGVITDIDLPESCDNSEIQAIWDSIFWESSTDISIVKNDSLTGGKCTEYFANKSDANEINYILYGYTKEVGGENISYVFAEKINVTEDYLALLNNMATSIENVSVFAPVKNDVFFETYVNLRIGEINPSNQEEIFNQTFEMNVSESWTKGSYLNNVSYSFSNTGGNETYTMTRSGKISSNYSYAFFSFNSKIIEEECEEDFDCGNWSDCLNDTQNQTCTDLNDCSEDYINTRGCGLTCTSLWNWSEWSVCTGGLQIRSVWDENSCGNNTGKPIMNQSCSGTDGCISDWSCDAWSPADCPQNGIQKRTCTDNNQCDIGSLTKSETQSCISESKSRASFNWIFILSILFVVGIILGLILFLLKTAKKKEDEKSGVGVVSSVTQPPVQPPVTPMISKPRQRAPLIKQVAKPARKILPFRPIKKPVPIPVVPTSPKSTMPKLFEIPVTQQPIPAKPVIQQQTQQVSPPQQMTQPIVSAKPVIQQPVNNSIKQDLNQIANPVTKNVPVIPVKKTLGK